MISKCLLNFTMKHIARLCCCSIPLKTTRCLLQINHWPSMFFSWRLYKVCSFLDWQQPFLLSLTISMELLSLFVHLWIVSSQMVSSSKKSITRLTLESRGLFVHIENVFIQIASLSKYPITDVAFELSVIFMLIRNVPKQISVSTINFITNLAFQLFGIIVNIGNVKS